MLYGFLPGNRNLLYSLQHVNRILIREQKYALRNQDSFQGQNLLPKSGFFSGRVSSGNRDLISHFDLDFF